MEGLRVIDARHLAVYHSPCFFDGWTNPARNSLVPRLVTKEQLVKANGLLSTSDQTVLLVGWGAGGLLVELLGAHQVLWLTAVCFLISTLSLFFIHDPHHKERVSPEKHLTGKR